jgi:hypothetical protein
VEEDGALAVSVVAAVTRALGRQVPAEELLALASEAARRAGGEFCHGVPAAVWGGVVLTTWWNGGAERLGVDPGRIEECLTLVDAGARTEEPPTTAGPPLAGVTEVIAEALRTGKYELVVQLLAREADATPAGTGQRVVIDAVRRAGGAARPLAGRLVAVWAPPGARGPGLKEDVSAALKAGGWRVLPIRVDLRGLEVD